VDEISPDFEKRSNSSKVKLMYTLRYIDFLFSDPVAKRKKLEVLDMVKETLGIDRITAKNTVHWDIDHQSIDTLEQLLKTEDYLYIIKEFIFNPRAWIFFLWDSEDGFDNPIFDVLEDYSKYEVSIKFPIMVERFQETPEIQEIEFTEISKDYPNFSWIMGFYHSFQGKCGNKIYNESLKSFVSDPRNVPGRSGWREVFPSAEDLNDPNLFIPLTVGGIKDDLYLILLRSTSWVNIWKNLHDYLSKNDPDFEEELNDYIYYNLDVSKSSLLNDFIQSVSPLTEKTIRALKINESDIVLFKIDIYSRINYDK
jgi:hypothetical protein